MSVDVSITIAVLGSVIALLWLGFTVYRQNATRLGFLCGEGHIPAWQSAPASLCMLGGLMLLTVAAQAYAEDGLARLGLFLSIPLGAWLVARFPAAKDSHSAADALQFPAAARLSLVSLSLLCAVPLLCACIAAGSAFLVDVYGLHRTIAVVIMAIIPALLLILDGVHSLVRKGFGVAVFLVVALFAALEGSTQENMQFFSSAFSPAMALQDLSWALAFPALPCLLQLRRGSKEHTSINRLCVIWASVCSLFMLFLLSFCVTAESGSASVALWSFGRDFLPLWLCGPVLALWVLVPAYSAEAITLGSAASLMPQHKHAPWLVRLVGLAALLLAAVLCLLAFTVSACSWLYWGLSLSGAAFAPMALAAYQRRYALLCAAIGAAVGLLWNVLLLPLCGIWGLLPGLAAHGLAYLLLTHRKG